MNIWITYAIIAVVLVAAELVYFKIADNAISLTSPTSEARIRASCFAEAV